MQLGEVYWPLRCSGVPDDGDVVFVVVQVVKGEVPDRAVGQRLHHEQGRQCLHPC